MLSTYRIELLTPFAGDAVVTPSYYVIEQRDNKTILHFGGPHIQYARELMARLVIAEKDEDKDA